MTVKLPTPYILTVDDDEDFNMLMKKSLKKLPVELKQTTTIETFLSELSHRKPDLCIIDINMGAMDGVGFQVIQAIRKKKGFEIPIMVMSRRMAKTDISNALELGANDYLSKPMDELILLNKVVHLLRANGIKIGTGDLSGISYKKVKESMTSCKITFPLELKSISEFGITVEGKHFLARGTHISLNHPVIEQILATNTAISLTVADNWINIENNACGAFLEFDTENENLLLEVRRWLVQPD